MYRRESEERIRRARVSHLSLRGPKGLANGELLAAAKEAGYDVLITVDKNMPHQQNLRGRGISVIDGRSTSFDDLVILMPDVLTAVDASQPGQLLRIGSR